MPKEYKSKIISYRINSEIRDSFIQACQNSGKKPSKLKRNWALNFMAGLSPAGDEKEFKVLSFEDAGNTNEQTHFHTIDEKTVFVEYCDRMSINVSDFFRTCEVNYIKSGNPNGS